MDATAAQTIDAFVGAATMPAQTQAAVSTAVLSSTMDVAQQMSAGLLAVMSTPAMDPNLGQNVDISA